MDPGTRARPREAHASPSPAVAANAEGDAIEVLESTDVLPMAPEDHWKTLFDQFDPESSGYISTEQFRSLLNTYGSELDPHKLAVLLALADSNADGMICYQDFVNLMSNKRSNSFRRAILQGNRQRKSAALLEEPGLGLSQRLVRHVAYETLPREVDRKWYYDSYTGCPPPWFIIAVAIVEVAVFVYYGLLLDRWVLQVSHPLYLRNPLVYHPQLRAQAWRYLSYIFMHAGIEHLSLNVLLQLLVGVPLEMVHGALRIGFLYISGVLAELVGNEVPIQTASHGDCIALHERGVRESGVAAFLPLGLPALPQPQLRGPPGRGGGGGHAGGGGPQELRAEAPGAVALVDLRLSLHHLHSVRHLLEHLRLQPAGAPSASPSLRTQAAVGASGQALARTRVGKVWHS
ncbi:rhomboid-related protein 3 isoform X2 [Polyodon spathula]|uniref:rhomboid-related protein 3 isoform X2 n=1 Tax=Polyodon spathula TaxID=7913 RepID=UPI001B7E659C|nr:rhomboid-related protein 3 isoform X2 [Polyodon spathula]